MKKEEGFSLSEGLISLFLTSIIMILLIQFYIVSKRQYRETEKIIESGLEVQWVDDLLSDSIRRAGFTPCLGIDQLQVIDQRNPKNHIQGLNIENQPNQFIQVSRMKEHFAKFIKMKSPSTLLVERSLVLSLKRPLLIADCDHAEIHELVRIYQQTNGTMLTLKKPITFPFDETTTYVGEFLEERWFIKENVQRKNTLHYQWIHIEELTPIIHSLFTERQSVQNRQVLKVNLGLEQDKTHTILVAVRGS